MKNPLMTRMERSSWTLAPSILALAAACSDSSSSEALATGQYGLELESLSVAPGEDASGEPGEPGEEVQLDRQLEPIEVLLGRAIVLPDFEDVAEAPTVDVPDALADARLGGSLELGAGGSGDDFDWYVRTGEIVFFDTTSTTVVGGPDGVPTTIRTFVDGVVDVRDLVIEEGGEIRVQGPNPMQVNASRNVIIRGELDLSGFQGRDVATLNTGNQPEIGGAGVAGGGNGGNSSENTTQTTLQGGTGLGAFQLPDGGGEGGESQFAPFTLGKDARRPGGGGGGRFALDACDVENDPDCAPEPGNFGAFGLAAEDGFDGHPAGTGAITGMMPAQGGAAGASVFVDGDPSNDFFGVGFSVDQSGQPAKQIVGELPALWAGAGGGGGGDAVPGVIDDPWTVGSDEKGGPGGGASGGLHVRALGEIVFGRFGLIRANGGRGGTGENTIFLDHVGASGGSGSGGHVVLESAVQIDFTDGGTNLGAGETTWIAALGGPRVRGAATTGGEVSFGGSGGPGVIQLHVPKPTLKPGPNPDITNIVVPFFQATARDPLEALATPVPYALFPMLQVEPAQGSLRTVVDGAPPLPGVGLDLEPASADFLRVPRRY